MLLKGYYAYILRAYILRRPVVDYDSFCLGFARETAT